MAQKRTKYFLEQGIYVPFGRSEVAEGFCFLGDHGTGGIQLEFNAKCADHSEYYLRRFGWDQMLEAYKLLKWINQQGPFKSGAEVAALISTRNNTQQEPDMPQDHKPQVSEQVHANIVMQLEDMLERLRTDAAYHAQQLTFHNNERDGINVAIRNIKGTLDSLEGWAF